MFCTDYLEEKHSGPAGRAESSFRYIEENGEVTLTEYLGGRGDDTPAEEAAESVRDLRLPSELDGYPVTAIGREAFGRFGIDIEKITVPGTIRTIAPHTFELCFSLRELILEEGVRELGREFAPDASLEEIRIPASVTSIERPDLLSCRILVDEKNPRYFGDGYGLFERKEGGGVRLLSVCATDPRESYAVPEGVTEIGERAFYGRSSLRRIEIPASVLEIEERTFSTVTDPFSEEGGLEEILVASGNPVWFLDGRALYGRRTGGTVLLRHLPPAPEDMRDFSGKLKAELHMREDTEVIASDAFLGCMAGEVHIPSGNVRIHGDAFRFNPVEEIVWDGSGGAIAFPADNTYQREHLLEAFGTGGGVYDFASYDEILEKESLNPDRLRMACTRLRSSGREKFLALDAEREELLREKIFSELPDVLPELADSGRQDVEVMLEEMGFFTEDNTERLIDGLRKSGRKQMMARLMDYKEEHFGHREFDFSL